jgi:hypothetical protein
MLYTKTSVFFVARIGMPAIGKKHGPAKAILALRGVRKVKPYRNASVLGNGHDAAIDCAGRCEENHSSFAPKRPLARWEHRIGCGRMRCRHQSA